MTCTKKTSRCDAMKTVPDEEKTAAAERTLRKARLSVQVVYRSCRSELSSGIRLSQANFYLAESGAG